MGLIKALVGAVGGGFGDQWLEVIEPADMGQNTVLTSGVTVRADDKRNSNKKGTADTVSNGSMIHVYDNQFMMLVDNGKIVDYTAEPGTFKVDNSSMPSMLGGQFGDSLKEMFGRIKYSGVPSSKQLVFYINLQEIKGIKFGTRTPLQYFDTFYGAELFLRAHGSYSIKVSDPIKFYQEAIPRNAKQVEIQDINEQYLDEFLTALTSAMNQMSAQGERISFLPSKGVELSKFMANTLDEDWNQMRGIQVQSVGLASISYDEESQKLINMRNQGAMLSDPSVREGYVQGSIARGMEAAGSNSAGAAQAFMGMGIGMQATGGAAAAFTSSNQAQMQASQAKAGASAAAAGWKCAKCGAENADGAKFCAECGEKKAIGWKCAKCGADNAPNAKFCAECGTKKSEPGKCPKCGADVAPGAKFCPECGEKM